MGNQKSYFKEVEVQYAFVDNKEIVLVCPFDEETIKKVVPSDITCANYRLGQVKNNKFYVFYAGRVTGEPLRQRLLEHLSEYVNYKDAHFHFIKQETEEAAYHQECKDFHKFQDIDEDGDNKYFKNKIHPARPAGSSMICNICGQ